MIELDLDGQAIQAGRVFCIGRNYAEHARELNNPVPREPVVFMKPASSLVAAGGALRHPRHGEDLHFEAEIVVLLGECASAGGLAAVAGAGLGLDLTLRDVQSALKAGGLPWERAKAFEQSAPISPLRRREALPALDALSFECRLNGELRQRGDSGLMLFPIARLVDALAAVWQLRSGDLIYTGTPAGVGPARRGDHLEVRADWLGSYGWNIV